MQSFAQTPYPSIRTGESLSPSDYSAPVESISAPPAADVPEPSIPTPEAPTPSPAAAILEPSDALEPPHRFTPPGVPKTLKNVDDPNITQESVYTHPNTPAPSQRSSLPKATPIPGGFDEDFGPRPVASNRMPVLLVGAAVAVAVSLVMCAGLSSLMGSQRAEVTPLTAAATKPTPAPIVIAPPPVEKAAPEIEEVVEVEPTTPGTPSTGRAAQEERAAASVPTAESNSPWGSDAPPAAAPTEAPMPAAPEKKKGMFKRKK